MRVFFGVLTFIAFTAQAEYRMFVLQITNNKTQASRTVYSNLDPLQYKSIYPLSSDESIQYTDTWRCKGNTNHYKIHCPKPPERIAENQSEAAPQN